MVDDTPDSQQILLYTPPILRADLTAIQDLLRTGQPLVPGVYFDDPYEATSYLPRQLIWREEFCLLVDRNLVTRWIGMVRGQPVSAQHRQAAAMMLFAQAADLVVEPTIAFHEIAGMVSTEELNRDLDDFYTAEEATPQAWASLALGRSKLLTLPLRSTRRPRNRIDMSLPLYHWRRSYILALKIASLHLEGGTPGGQMMRLLDWMFAEFLIGGPAVQLASYYFAPGAPRRRLLKSIESADRDKALQGVRNAAWDLTLISEWLRRVTASAQDPSEKRLWILATLDVSVGRMARDLISFDEGTSEVAHLEKAFAKVWRPDAATQLALALHGYLQDSLNPSRHLNRDPQGEAISGLIASGEQVIREWTPRRVSDRGRK